MWWVAVHLPALSLESFVATFPGAGAAEGEADGQGDAAPAGPRDWPEPVLLLERQRVVAVNEAARARGIEPGQRRATAMALAPEARCGEADPARDDEALRAVACAMLAFTPAVSLGARDTVLAEVKASLRYFGGLPRLVERLRATLAPLGHRVQVAVAPTAQGAQWLATWRDDLDVPPAAPGTTWRSRLQSVPIACVVAAGPSLPALQALGLHVVADLRRQPRDGLARRFGDALLDEMDAAFGDRPDPRDALVPPPVFDSRLELFARAESADALLAGASVLLARLVAWAGALHGRIAAFQLVLHPETRRRVRDREDGGRTVIDLALASPLADAAHLQSLLRERLQRHPLAAPVIELSLHCHQLVPGEAPSGELFPSAASLREGWQRLLERLEARLGPGRVQQVEAVDDHRPERATRVRPGPVSANVAAQSRRTRGVRRTGAGGGAGVAALPAAAAAATTAPPAAPASAPASTPASTLSATPGRALAAGRPAPASTSVPVPAARQRRPVWLVTPSRPLTERQGLPCLDGQPLVLLAGPERIESGWWDGDLVARDYFIAQAPDGRLLWVWRFRHAPEGRGAGWHLQGRFG